MTAAQRSYNAVLKAIKAANPDLSHKQAQAAWRGLKQRLGDAPKKADLKAHPRITKEEVKRAPARERAQRAAATRAKKKAEAEPKPKAKPAKPSKPKAEPKPKGKAAEKQMAQEKMAQAKGAAKRRKTEAQDNWDYLDYDVVEIEDPIEGS